MGKVGTAAQLPHWGMVRRWQKIVVRVLLRILEEFRLQANILALEEALQEPEVKEKSRTLEGEAASG